MRGAAGQRDAVHHAECSLASDGGLGAVAHDVEHELAVAFAVQLVGQHDDIGLALVKEFAKHAQT